MLTYYPPIAAYDEHKLAVDELHTLHIEQCGNPNGLPILFVHGGPGSGCKPDHRRYFDPTVYRIILFDQRGCGRSMPHAELQNNTTQALVEDMEKIRKHLGIEQWLLFGGSWGSTLSLVYAQTYPERVLGLILRGILLGREQDKNWFYQNGASHIFPDYWQEFIQTIPLAERENLIEAYHKRLTGNDELVRMAAAKAWSKWEGCCLTLEPSHVVVESFMDPTLALSLARIECHYFINDCFLAPNQILNQISRISRIPGIIIHGRYDMVCPVDNAWELHRAWPLSQLTIIRDAGHAASEIGITDALIHATKSFAQQYG